MGWIRDWFNVLPLRAAIEALYRGTLPSRALSISFDDGYSDNEELAAPILQRLGLSATFFVSTGYLFGGCMWNDTIIEAVRGTRVRTLDLTTVGLGEVEVQSLSARRSAITHLLASIKHLEPEKRSAAVEAVVAAACAEPPKDLMMRPEQLRRLRQLGMDVGAHTVNHPILANLGEREARLEIAQGKAQLEDIFGEAVELFAYPNGVPNQDYRQEHVRFVRDLGFAGAVSTAWGAASMRSDRFQLPRFTPWDRSRFRYGARLLWNLRSASHRIA
jgi:peptidoglycan/xylan/chitin deacetylase (PgdA/CDA1 family)